MLNPVPSTRAVLCGARVCLLFCAAWIVGSVEINALGQAVLGRLVGGVTNAEPTQGSLSPGVQAAAGMKSIEERLAETRAELRAAEMLGDGAGTNVPAGISLQLVAARRGLLDRLVRLLEQQAANSAEVLLAGKRRDELAREAKAWTRFPDPPPYSILLTDRLREEIQAEQLKVVSGESTVATLEQLIAENRDALTQAEEKIRQLNERLEGAPDPSASSGVTWMRDLERLRSQVAAASLALLDSESRLRQEGLAESRIRLDLLKHQLAVADANPQFTQSDLDKVITRPESGN